MTAKEYNECVQEWSDALYRFVYVNLSQLEDAQDVVQQSFETLWIERGKVPKEKAKSFLFTVGYRRCMDHHRQRKRERTDTIDEQFSFFSHNNNYEWKEYLQKALDSLDDTSRSLILLKDIEGYKYEEIAVLTDLNVAQVKVYLHRARKKMKAYITPSLKVNGND